MKIIKKIVFVILSLIVLTLVSALFMRKDYAVEREITINKPKDSVFNYIKFLKNQDQFSVWAKKDPNMKKSFSGVDGTVGAIASWESQNAEIGTGEQEIKKIITDERMDMELRFTVPFEATDKAYFITESVSANETKVKWGFNGTMAYPMNLMLTVMKVDELLGNDLSEGLKNLKIILEK